MSGFVTLLTGAATQLGALSDWTDRVFLGFGGGWALVSKLAAQLLAIGLAYRVITETRVINSDSTYSISQHSYFSSGSERLAAKALFAFVLLFSFPAIIYTELIKGLTAPLVLHGTCVCSGSLTPLTRAIVQLRDREGHDLLRGPELRTDDDGVFNAERTARWPIPYLFVFGEPAKEYVSFFREVKSSDGGVQVQVDCKGEKR
ncbi:hypothetical protein [Tunturiibacter gelidoferens]|uniref:Uncharacterized protein n=1 Tax=Tunturiibacter lichenicola TaxID=2051959 RepID=A0A7Y9T3R7_9BACT|nr:hypothetical protein [Edaphobacter lichenicola]NYF53173.1 hypothetical protein [Edaphobacter lichenicola]